MIIKLLKEDLKKALTIFSGISSAKTTLPVLSGTLFKIDNNAVELTAYNLEYGATISMLTTNINNEKGAFVLDTATLLNCVKRFSDDDVTFEVELPNVTIRCGKTKYTIVSISGEDFPELPSPGTVEKSISFDSEEILNGIKETVFAANVDSNGKFEGLNIFADDGKLYFRAIDGYRTAEKSYDTKLKNFSAIVKADIAKFICNTITNTKAEKVKIVRAGNLMVLNVDDITVISRTLTGDNYDFSKFRVKAYNEIVVNSDEFQLALEQVSPTVENSLRNPVHITGHNGKLFFESKSTLGKSSSQCLAEFTGDIDIGFNIKFLYDAVKSINDETLVIRYANASSPIEIHAKDKSNWCLVLPVRLK